MIATQHVTMQLAAGGQTVTILDDVTIDIPEKQTVAIIGPSGSGKSTLLGLIAGLDRPTSGTIWLNGVEITALGERGVGRGQLDRRGRADVQTDDHARLVAGLPERVPVVAVKARHPELLGVLRPGHSPDASGGDAAHLGGHQLGVPIRGALRRTCS